MIALTDVRRCKHYVAASDVVRLTERQYDGGGTIVILGDGTRIKTYEPMDSLHKTLAGQS